MANAHHTNQPPPRAPYPQRPRPPIPRPRLQLLFPLNNHHRSPRPLTRRRPLACDTSEHATDLIAPTASNHRRGYQTVAHTNWDPTNDQSLILSLPLQ